MFNQFSKSFLTSFFASMWDLIHVTYPGTNVTVFGVIAGITIGLFLFKIITGFISGTMFSSATSPHRSGPQPKINPAYIDDSRKGDTK